MRFGPGVHFSTSDVREGRERERKRERDRMRERGQRRERKKKCVSGCVCVRESERGGERGRKET